MKLEKLRWQRTRPSLFHALWLTLFGIVLAANSGCAAVQGVRNVIAYNDCTDDFVASWRGGAWAVKAWHRDSHQFADRPHFRAFGDGYRQGYKDVVLGSNGCPPPLPPRKYWSWKYQTAEGQGKVAAWFDGYPHGARAAEQDGAGNWLEIQVSQPIQTQYSQEFRNPSLPEFVDPTSKSTKSGPESRSLEPIPAGKHPLLPDPPDEAHSRTD